MIEQPDADCSLCDAALARLAGETTLDERFEILQTLVVYWNGPVQPGDGLRPDEIGGASMPHVLRRWYEWAGRRDDILSGQNFLLAPNELEVEPESGLLLFHRENQGVFEWATNTGGDDAAVFMREGDPMSPWERERLSLYEHLIQTCLFEASMGAPYSASIVGPDEDVFVAIERIIPRVPLAPWLWSSARMHHSRGLVMHVLGTDGNDRSIWIGARDDRAVDAIRPFVGEDWDHVSF